MDGDKSKSYRKAGKIAVQALEYGITILKEDTLLFDATLKIEEKIKALGGQLAFPINMSLNTGAAHFTPLPGDQTKVQSIDTIKLDVGVHVDGYIGDNARTIGPEKELIKASADALNNAIKICKAGIKVCEIGRVVEDTITKAGFNPIRNLTGHGLAPYELHSGVTIPNYDNGDENTLKAGDVIAIEPFATNGIGMIRESSPSGIYRLVNNKPVRLGRDIVQYITQQHQSMPFVARWITDKFPSYKVRFLLNNLEKNESIHQYAKLVEKQDGLVAQTEHTVLITDDGAEVLTKDDE